MYKKQKPVKQNMYMSCRNFLRLDCSQGQLIGNIGGEESNYCMSRGLIPEVFGSKETLVTSFEVLHAGTQTNSQYHLNQSVQTDDQVSALVHPETQTSNDPFKASISHFLLVSSLLPPFLLSKNIFSGFRIEAEIEIKAQV